MTDSSQPDLVRSDTEDVAPSLLEVADPTADEDFDEGELQSQVSGDIKIEKADRSLSEFKRWYDDGDLTIDPEWQRDYVWSRKQASLLVESFLLGIPVPVIYLAKTEDNKYEVIDGLQRLTSVFKFLDNQLILTGLGLRPELNGQRYKDLNTTDKRQFKNSVLRTFELHKDTKTDIHFIVFERLNTGGTRLNEMEIRNCIYRGKLNDLIKELADSSDFTNCVNYKKFTRMQDRTLILRFLAFYERTHLRCTGGMKKFLNEFMETYRNPPRSKLDAYRDVFNLCMRSSLTVFGNDGFRLKNDPASKSRSAGEWATRVNAAIFQCVATSFAGYSREQITNRADCIYEEYLDLITTDTTWIDYVRRATAETSRLEYVFDTWRERLKQAMRGADATAGGSRVFSKQLKKELYDQNSNCGICGNRIVLLDDAALDHVHHYWRGGQTIPENARLVHRFCNLQRGGRDT